MTTQEQTQDRDPRHITRDEMIFLFLFKQYERVTSDASSTKRQETRAARNFVEHVMGKKYPVVYRLKPEQARYCAREIAKWLHEQIEKADPEETAVQP